MRKWASSRNPSHRLYQGGQFYQKSRFRAIVSFSSRTLQHKMCFTSTTNTLSEFISITPRTTSVASAATPATPLFRRSKRPISIHILILQVQSESFSSEFQKMNLLKAAHSTRFRLIETLSANLSKNDIMRVRKLDRGIVYW